MTIREFARLAGVSVSTVSKIMNHKDSGISAETRERVLRLAKEYDYKPYASVAPQTRTLTLGVLFRDTQDIGMLASGILSAASKGGYSLLLRESADSPEAERRQLSALLSMHIDGLLWEPVSADSLALLSGLQQLPVCLLNPPCGAEDVYSDAAAARPSTGVPSTENPAQIPGAAHVPGHSPALRANAARSALHAQTAGPPVLDFFAMGYFVTQQLIEKGHTEIACLLAKGTRTAQFYEGYKRCLFDHQLPFDKALVFSAEASLPIGKIASHSFSGMVVSHYAAAMKLYAAIEALHYEIPYDLSIVSLKDDARPQIDYPPLSTLTIPHRAYGEQLTAYLISLLESAAAPQPADLSLALDNELTISLPYHAQKKKVISVGSINLDTYLNFETLPRTGKTAAAPTSTVYPGGKCLNQAVGIARLGHAASVIGRTGNDSDADLIYASLHELQIDTLGLLRSRGARTGQAYIFVQRDGNSMISIMSGANHLVSAADVLRCERLFSNASYCLLQTEIPLDAIIQAAELAKRHKLTTVVKPSTLSVLPEALLACTDILVANEEEFAELCRHHCPEKTSLKEQTDDFLEKGLQAVVVTQGALGCYLRTPALEQQMPAADVVSIDRTGAGDAFISAMVSYLLYGYQLKEAVQIATYAAGISTTRQGVSSALIDRSSLEAYVRQAAPGLLHE